ncbi:MAG: HXXEE domain-containing protein, partial [Pyrinomonadaceae bacterium]
SCQIATTMNWKNKPSDALTTLLLWLFPLSYLIHIAEEYWGGEGYPAYILRLRGVHLSTARFLLAQSVGFFLVTIGVILARRFHFPQMMLVTLGAIVLVNGITHTVTSLSVRSYGPGLVTSALIWMPLGIFVLLRFKDATSKRRYWLAVAIGVGVNVVIAIFTMRGGRIA